MDNALNNIALCISFVLSFLSSSGITLMLNAMTYFNSSAATCASANAQTRQPTNSGIAWTFLNALYQTFLITVRRATRDRHSMISNIAHHIVFLLTRVRAAAPRQHALISVRVFLASCLPKHAFAGRPLTTFTKRRAARQPQRWLRLLPYRSRGAAGTNSTGTWRCAGNSGWRPPARLSYIACS